MHARLFRHRGFLSFKETGRSKCRCYELIDLGCTCLKIFILRLHLPCVSLNHISCWKHEWMDDWAEDTTSTNLLVYARASYPPNLSSSGICFLYALFQPPPCFGLPIIRRNKMQVIKRALTLSLKKKRRWQSQYRVCSYWKLLLLRASNGVFEVANIARQSTSEGPCSLHNHVLDFFFFF